MTDATDIYASATREVVGATSLGDRNLCSECIVVLKENYYLHQVECPFDEPELEHKDLTLALINAVTAEVHTSPNMSGFPTYQARTGIRDRVGFC